MTCLHASMGNAPTIVAVQAHEQEYAVTALTTLERQLTAANQHDTGTIRVPELRVGRLTHASILRAFADLRSRGCEVTWAQRERGVLSTAYYNVTITGEAIYLAAFLRFVRDLAAS